MNLKQAQDVAAEYGGFLEWAHSRLFTIFFSDIPESLLPYTPQYIEDSLNIVAENYHNHRDFEKVKLLQETIGTLIFYKDDEKAILQVLEFISEEKWRDLRWRDLTIEKIKDFRTKDQKHISSYFKEKPFEEIDFENLDYSTAYKMVDITSRCLKSAHIPLCSHLSKIAFSH